MQIVIALVIITAYWILDLYNSSLDFKDAIVDNFILKIFVTVAIFAFVIFQKKIASIKDDEFNLYDTNELETFKKASKIMTSPLPVVTQATQIIELLENSLDIDCAFICEYQNDDIVIINKNSTLSKFNIRSRYLAHKENLEPDSIDELLSKLFLERRYFIEKEVTTPLGIYKAYANSLTKESTNKPFGSFIILSKSDHNYTHFLNSITELISFSISLHQRKVASEKFQEKLEKKDDHLNIPTNTHLQMTIEEEFHRFQRYQNDVSLIILEIDHMQNLQNIFNEKIMLKLKQEFVKVIQKNIRTTDSFGKWTDDRFAIVAPGIDFRAAKNFANKLTRVLSEHRFSTIGKITCSYGATSLAKDEQITQFRKRAEDALNEAIKKGGNSIEIKILI